MRVLFVLKQVDYEPQGILHLSSVLGQAGHQVRLCIVSQEDPIEAMEEFRPAIVGYSVTTGLQKYYLELNRRVKESFDVFSVFGGPHPTFFPEMVEEDGVDGICIGEGEGAMLDLAELLENGSVEPNTGNWWFKLNGEIVRNGVRPLIHDLSSLPRPDRSLIYEKQPALRSSSIKHFLAGPKRFKKELVRQLLQNENGLTSDEAIRARLLEKFGVAISRRSVAKLRQELKLPPRGKSGKGKEIT